MKITAYLVLFIFWIFALGPCLFGGHYPKYWDDVKTTFLVTLFFAGIAGVCLVLNWAVIEVVK